MTCFSSSFPSASHRQEALHANTEKPSTVCSGESCSLLGGLAHHRYQRKLCEQAMVPGAFCLHQLHHLLFSGQRLLTFLTIHKPPSPPRGGRGAPPHRLSCQVPPPPTNRRSAACNGYSGSPAPPGSSHLQKAMILNIECLSDGTFAREQLDRRENLLVVRDEVRPRLASPGSQPQTPIQQWSPRCFQICTSTLT